MGDRVMGSSECFDGALYYEPEQRLYLRIDSIR
jgi:hypothetical protein